MKIEPKAGMVLRNVCGGLVIEDLLGLALAVPGLVSDRDRTAVAPTLEAQR